MYIYKWKVNALRSHILSSTTIVQCTNEMCDINCTLNTKNY